MSGHRLLLVPSFTELEWGIADSLSEWAEIATFDMPGVGDEPRPEGFRPGDEVQEIGPSELQAWREAGAARGLEEVDARGWESFAVVTDSHGSATAVRLVEMRPGAVLGLAIGHAALSRATTGERAPMSGEVWAALGQLARQGKESFVRYGLAQMTRGGVSEELAAEMIERFGDMDAMVRMIEALGREPEPIGERLAELGLPLLLAKHEGCLAHTDEGYEDIVAALPDARSVICPEACPSSPAFAAALREFCEAIAPPVMAEGG